jgi:hypothetical protein
MAFGWANGRKLRTHQEKFSTQINVTSGYLYRLTYPTTGEHKFSTKINVTSGYLSRLTYTWTEVFYPDKRYIGISLSFDIQVIAKNRNWSVSKVRNPDVTFIWVENLCSPVCQTRKISRCNVYLGRKLLFTCMSNEEDIENLTPGRVQDREISDTRG